MAHNLNLILNATNGPFTYTCGEGKVLSQGCPYAFQLFEKDKKDGFLHKFFDSSPGEAPVDACSSFPRQRDPGLWEYGELEAEYARNKFTKIGLDENYLSRIMPMCYQPEIWQEDPNSVQYEKNTIVAMTYHYLNRVKMGSQQNFLEISNLNSLLGKELTDGIPCEQYVTPDDASLCLKSKEMKCAPKGGVAKLTESLAMNAIMPILQLKKKLRSLNRRSHRNKRKKINDAIKAIESNYPILKGDEFQDYLKDGPYRSLEMPSPEALTNALKSQLESNKAAVIERIKKNNGLNRCLIYGHPDDCEDFDKEMANNPYDSRAYLYTREDYLQEGGQERLPKMGSASAYYSSISCFDNFREIKDGVNELALDTGLNAGLFFATMGAGAVVGLGRTAMLASRGIALSADLAFLGKSVSDTIKTCKDSFDKLVGDSFYNSQDQNFHCPEGPESPHFTAVDDMRSCVTAAILTPIDALPLIPAGAWRSLRTAKSATQQAVHQADEALHTLVSRQLFHQCLRGSKSRQCKEFIDENREQFKEMAQKCLTPGFAGANRSACLRAEEFMKNNPVLRLSDLIPAERQGKSVVVEFSGDRGHVVLRYMMETVDENGNKIMKSLSQDGSSFLFPRRINERWFQGRKDIRELGDMDKYVPGSHYIIDATPEQLETLLKIQQRGGFSRACTHDARRALDEAGILEMPKGLSAPYRKIGIREMAKDLTTKYGPPDANTTRAIQELLDPKKAGFSDEQWRNFLKTEAGWGVLTPLAVFGLYPAFVPLTAINGLVATDAALALTGHDGEVLYITMEKVREVYAEYARENGIDIQVNGP